MIDSLLILFIVISLGLVLGNFSVKGISLGTSGVLFVSLAAGHLQWNVPEAVGTFGLAIFVYCIGVGAGARFFTSLARQGSKLAILAFFIVGSGALVTWLFAQLMRIPSGMAVGIFAGACTSTPALAAAIETLSGMPGEPDISIGYGIAYPFGVIGVVLFVQLLPRLLKFDFNKKEADGGYSSGDNPVIKSQLIRFQHSGLEGELIADHRILEQMNCRVTRLVRDGRLMPIGPEDCFEKDMLLLLVGEESRVNWEACLIGDPVENPYVMDVDRERRKVIVTNRILAGKKISDLKTLSTYGITISRITRLGFTFVPSGNTIVERNDVLTVVGLPDKIESFAKLVGHRSLAMNLPDLLSLCIGIALGLLLGMLEVGPPGGSRVSLGVAGGPLIVGILLGHIGKLGPIVGYIPRPTRIFMMDFGLVLFLASAGMKGGTRLVEAVTEYGAIVFIMGVAVTTVPLITGVFVARKFLGMNLLELLGGICGGMTSTPALGAISSQTDSQEPVVSYATSYPVALILMTIFARIIIEALGGA